MSEILKTFLKYAATQKEPSKGLVRAVNKAWSLFAEESTETDADALGMDSTLIKLGLAKKVKDKETGDTFVQYKGVS